MKNYLPQLIPSTFVETKHFVMGCPTLDLAFLTLQVMKGYIWNTGSSSVLPCSSHIPSSKGSGMRLGMASFPSHVEWPGNEARPGIVVLTKHSGSICTQPCRIHESECYKGRLGTPGNWKWNWKEDVLADSIMAHGFYKVRCLGRSMISQSGNQNSVNGTFSCGPVNVWEWC